MKHNATLFLSHLGHEAVPEYSIRHPDPSLPASRNRYAVALYDVFNPDILFGEILLIPQWTVPNLSQEEIRANKGVPPAPQPLLPTEFTIQLYNPDQQVLVKLHHGSWSSAPYWEFEMPQQSFRQPSNSTLDRTQNDPTAVESTPKSIFRWRKDGKLSKDYVCSLSGKSTNLQSTRRKHKEPDITIALFRHLKEITIYEPNLSRVDMEDFKGLEVVLLLGAIVLREVLNGQLKDVFNIVDLSIRDDKGSGLGNPSNRSPLPPPRAGSAPFLDASASHLTSASTTKPQLRIETPNPRLPPTDPRSQWEIDLETARLKKQVAHEDRERRRLEYAETKRVKKMVEAEQRAARAKLAEIDQETDRLRKLYPAEQQSIQAGKRPLVSSRHDRPPSSFVSVTHAPSPRPPSAAAAPTAHSQTSRKTSGLYLQAQKNPSTNGFFGGSRSAQNEASRLQTKRSMFGLRSVSDEHPRRLAKKQSMLW